MLYKPYKPGKALWYALLLWLIGFVWGIVVFTVPALKDIPAIPYISKYPAVSAPLIVVYVIIIFLLTRRYLEDTDKKAIEGLKFGMAVFLVNIILDAMVYVIMLKSPDYFAYFSIWLFYILAIAVPWFTGRWLESKNGRQY